MLQENNDDILRHVFEKSHLLSLHIYPFIKPILNPIYILLVSGIPRFEIAASPNIVVIIDGTCCICDCPGCTLYFQSYPIQKLMSTKEENDKESEEPPYNEDREQLEEEQEKGTGEIFESEVT